MLTPSVFGLCSVLALAVDPDTSPSAAPKPPVEFPHPLITEILYAVPKGDAGDANQDGKRSPTGDEFVELINPHDKPINLKGYVPALLLESGELLTEGPAIVQYIADQAPAAQIAPANGTIERYRLQGWLNYIGTELHKSCSAFFNPMAKDDWKSIARANLERRLRHIDEHLGAGNAYLLGERFSVADGYLFTVLRWMAPIGFDLAPFPAIQAYQARVGARPAVQAALKAEGLA